MVGHIPVPQLLESYRRERALPEAGLMREREYSKSVKAVVRAEAAGNIILTGEWFEENFWVKSG
jgi:hypothetical protein